MKKALLVITISIALPSGLGAQQTYTLDECKHMALSADNSIEQAREDRKMSEYDRKTALANCFPNVSATGAYLHNSKNLSLVSNEQSASLVSIGTRAQGVLSSQVQDIMSEIMANPSAVQEYLKSPLWQTAFHRLSSADVSSVLNAIGSSVDQALHLDIRNVYVGAISVQQPVFMGGKIIASNQIASLACTLSDLKLDERCEQVELETEQIYWQVVSLSAKQKLALSYLDMLTQMESDAKTAVDAGVSVQSDVLSVKVKLNEARMLVSKTENGLALSRMLLCVKLGLPLDSDIRLADENCDRVPSVSMIARKDMDDVIGDRNETKMLDLASKIYDRKVAVVRADYLPKIALTGNYLISNPNLYNGFSNSFSGIFNVGVAVSIPIFHATEGIQKTRKAQSEARLCKLRYDDACSKVSLQLEQLTRAQDEALQRLDLSESSLANAEENLRAAMLGFAEGVVSSDVALQAQTAWLKAHSEYIDAGIDLQLNHSHLLKAQGEYK